MLILDPWNLNTKSMRRNPVDRLRGVRKTSSRFIDNLILDKAVSTLSLTHPTSNYEKTVPPLVGAKFTIQMTSDENDDLNPEASIVWDKCHRMETSYEPRCLEWLGSNILAELGPGTQTHKRKTTRGEKFIFRAHPSWRGGVSSNDWAMFSWADTDASSVHIPTQIITFIEFVEEDISKLQHLPFLYGDTSGPIWSTCCGVTSLELNDHCRNGMPLAAMNLCLVSVDTIYEPIATIPDEGGTPGDFLFIRPADNWGYGFTQLIEDNEAAPEDNEAAELHRSPFLPCCDC
jgi:hypothetical protein